MTRFGGSFTSTQTPPAAAGASETEPDGRGSEAGATTGPLTGGADGTSDADGTGPGVPSGDPDGSGASSASGLTAGDQAGCVTGPPVQGRCTNGKPARLLTFTTLSASVSVA